jgi:hypothetical protein
MNGLIIFMGESFRVGTQGTRNRGSAESYTGQIGACNSHIRFIEHIISSHNLNSISVHISSYTTQYDNDLLAIYDKYLIGRDYYDNPIGISTLFHNTINNIENISQYDFTLYIRIDLFLKPPFMEIFDPTINMILFPTIVWKWDCIVDGHPRINGMMTFIPKKYYDYLKYFQDIQHNTWRDLVITTDLTYDDMDTMIHTYHDSDSYKDMNPLYYIVNRPETTQHHSPGLIFDKYNFI